MVKTRKIVLHLLVVVRLWTEYQNESIWICLLWFCKRVRFSCWKY